MQFHDLQREHARKRARQVGRGGKRGKTSGRGTKGQKARAGRKIRPEIRDVIKRVPKLRGRGKNSNLSITAKPVIVALRQIEKFFSHGDTVTPETLVQRGLIRIRKGKDIAVKILGDGEITKKVTVLGCRVSSSAKIKLEKAGSTIVIP